jgi:phenylacetate-CoA ligase
MTTSTVAFPQLGQWSSIEDLIRMQEEQLPTALGLASRSPFYHARLAGHKPSAGLAALAELPLTSKADLKASYPFGMLAVPTSQLATYHESSGTSGEPTSSFYTANDWIDIAERYARKWVGLSDDDVFLVRAPYALPLTGHLAHAAGRLKGATIVPGDARSSAMPYSRVIRVLHDLGVTLTWSMPTECLLWAAAARVAGYEPAQDFPALRALFVGGEPLSAARRKRLTALWGVPVVEEYGSTETGTIAGECQEGRLHIWADRLVPEVYDPATGTSSREGRGELLITTLCREAMPLVRYNLQDNVEVSYDECPCGWHLPTVKVEGRSTFEYRVLGSVVTQQRLEDLVFELPDSYDVLFWRARADSQCLNVEIEVPAEHSAAACRDLGASITAEYAIPRNVRPLPPGTLVPHSILAASQDVVKPRSLFGPGEDWSKAIVYF